MTKILRLTPQDDTSCSPSRAPILRRANAKKADALAGEVALVAVAGAGGDLGDRVVRREEAGRCPLAAHSAHVFADRHAVVRAELAREVRRVYPGERREVSEAQSFTELVVQQLARARQPARLRH